MEDKFAKSLLILEISSCASALERSHNFPFHSPIHLQFSKEFSSIEHFPPFWQGFGSQEEEVITKRINNYTYFLPDF